MRYVVSLLMVMGMVACQTQAQDNSRWPAGEAAQQMQNFRRSGLQDSTAACYVAALQKTYTFEEYNQFMTRVRKRNTTAEDEGVMILVKAECTPRQ